MVPTCLCPARHPHRSVPIHWLLMVVGQLQQTQLSAARLDTSQTTSIRLWGPCATTRARESSVKAREMARWRMGAALTAGLPVVAASSRFL